MTRPTAQDINDALEMLVRYGHLVAIRDEAGAVRLAPREWAAAHDLTDIALSDEEVAKELSAREPELMGKWN